MNAMVGHFSSEGPPARNPRKPIMRCPVCGSQAINRSSEEISVETRRLYYQCSNFRCCMRWVSILSLERVTARSSLSTQYRPFICRDKRARRAPGHDFGQMSMIDLMREEDGAATAAPEPIPRPGEPPGD